MHGPMWFRLFKPWIPKFLYQPASPPVPGLAVVTAFTYGTLQGEWGYRDPGYDWVFGDPEN